MRVLLASSSSGSRGGGEIYLLYVGRALAARGHEVVLWASNHERMDELAAEFAEVGEVIRSPYVNTYDHRLRSLATLFNTDSLRRIAREWQAVQPDILHVNKQNLEDGLDLLRAAKLSGLKSVCTIHLTQSARYLKARSAWSRDLAARVVLRRFSGHFISVQERRAEDLARFLGVSHAAHGIHVVHNGVPVPDADGLALRRPGMRKELGVPDNSLLVLGVARLMPQKRPQVFLDTARKILDVLPEARFVWIGSGWLDGEWDGWVRERGLENFVQRVPWTRDVISHLAAADVFLHTAEYEGMPLAIFEAMAAGLPCLLTPNLLDDMPFLGKETAIAVGEADWLGRLASVEERERVAAAGCRLVREKFSIEAMGAATEAIYRRVMSGQPGGGVS